MVMVIGAFTAVSAIVLSFVMHTPWFLILFLPGAMAIGGGALVLRGARRSQMRIDAAGFTWAGFFGAQRSVRWTELDRIMPPTPDDRLLVGFALLRDGRWIPVRAVWEPAAWPVMWRAPHVAPVYHALIAAHQEWLARHR